MNTDLEDALTAWQGGELPAGRADALLEKLRADAGLRLAFSQQVWTLSLTRVAQSPDPRWIALQEELELAGPSSAPSQAGFEASLMQAVRREPPRFVSAIWRRGATLAAAAAVLLAGLLAYQNMAQDGTGETLAVLVPASETEPSRAISAGRLRLAGGRSRLLFTSGVILDVEGPAELEVLSVSRVACVEGRLRTQVPPGAEGFSVETPRGTVTDLGTVLGISVSRAGGTDVGVFEGQAELSTRIPGQEGLRTAVLNVHETARLASGGGIISAGKEADFLQAMPPSMPTLRLPADYAGRVLAAKPSHYWRLNHVMDGGVPNEIQGGPVLLISGGVEIGSSARFHGKESPGVLHAEKPWLAPASGHAIEFWFMPTAIGQMALAALTTAEPMRPHLSLVESGGRRPGEAAAAGVLRHLLRWPPGHRDGMNLYSPTTAALPYQWHHVVAQQQAGRMELFLNGRRIGPAVADDAPGDSEVLLQLGALELRPGQELAKLRRPFTGLMAEVALYGRTLSPAEVMDHARLK